MALSNYNVLGIIIAHDLLPPMFTPMWRGARDGTTNGDRPTPGSHTWGIIANWL